MDERELYPDHTLSIEERRRMSEALRRLEAESEQQALQRSAARSTARGRSASSVQRDPATRKGATQGKATAIRKRPRKPKKVAPSAPESDTSAHATLDAQEWLALLRPLPPLGNALAVVARNAIRAKCNGVNGPVTIWGTVEGFQAILSALVKDFSTGRTSPPGFNEACRVAADLTAQCSKTMKW